MPRVTVLDTSIAQRTAERHSANNTIDLSTGYDCTHIHLSNWVINDYHLHIEIPRCYQLYNKTVIVPYIRYIKNRDLNDLSNYIL